MDVTYLESYTDFRLMKYLRKGNNKKLGPKPIFLGTFLEKQFFEIIFFNVLFF
jgi:hypothetical protein